MLCWYHLAVVGEHCECRICFDFAKWAYAHFEFEKTHIILNLLSHFEFEIRDTNQEPLNEIMREKRDSYFSVLRNTNLKFGKTDVNLISLMSDHVSLFWSDMIRSRSPLNANWIVTKKYQVDVICFFILRKNGQNFGLFIRETITFWAALYQQRKCLTHFPSQRIK